MTLLTTDQITEIAEALEALGEELGSRNWAPDLAGSVVTAIAGTLAGHALMRAPVPQQAYIAPPPYPYGPGDSSRNAPGSLQLTVTGNTRADLEERARQHGERFFGADAGLTVTLTTPACAGQVLRPGDPPAYTCRAIVRQQEPAAGGPRYPVRDTDKLLG